jgi:hypothetical protein
MSKLKKLINHIFTSGRIDTQLTISFTDTIAGTSSGHPGIQSRRFDDPRRAENGLLIWLDGNIDEMNNKTCSDSILQLRNIFNSIHFFKDCEQWIDFLNGIIDEKAYMIIFERLGEMIVPKTHSLIQVDSIYIFCMDKPKHEQWANE